MIRLRVSVSKQWLSISASILYGYEGRRNSHVQAREWNRVPPFGIDAVEVPLDVVSSFPCGGHYKSMGYFNKWIGYGLTLTHLPMLQVLSYD